MSRYEKEHIPSFDFIRSICAIGIVIYHYSGAQKYGTLRLLLEFTYGKWGYEIVTMFFMLSGASIYHNNLILNDMNSIKVFYKKRARSLFPMYYIMFILLYGVRVVLNKSIFYKGHPSSLLLSVLGLDGYLNYKFVTYYQVGEWFLGAIILLYLIYPLILKAFNKNEYVTIFASLIFTIIVVSDRNHYFQIESFRNLFSCLFSFLMGMYLIRHRYWESSKLIIGSSILIGGMILCTNFLPLDDNVAEHCLGICMYIVLYKFGQIIMKKDIFKKVFECMSKLSYPIFLVQHITISAALKVYMPRTDATIVVYLLVVLVAVIIEASVLSVVVNKIVNKMDTMLHKEKLRI